MVGGGRETPDVAPTSVSRPFADVGQVTISRRRSAAGLPTSAHRRWADVSQPTVRRRKLSTIYRRHGRASVGKVSAKRRLVDGRRFADVGPTSANRPSALSPRPSVNFATARQTVGQPTSARRRPVYWVNLPIDLDAFSPQILLPVVNRLNRKLECLWNFRKSGDFS